MLGIRTGPQDGRQRQNHRTMLAAQLLVSLNLLNFCINPVNFSNDQSDISSYLCHVEYVAEKKVD